ncbi:MAG TPA: outer membrane lipoprotein carrier protein LolA [Alphaproteobacteria bacterium]
MKKLILLALVALLIPASAWAKDSRVQQAETWLNNLDTATAHFEQKGFDGRVASGNFFIDRPGRLRFEYTTSKDIAVADGVMIHFYDAENNQSSSSPIGLTLADFLLRKHIRLEDDDLSVTNIRTKGGIVSMAVAQTADPGAGQLILNFTEEPFQLLSWVVIDPQGLVTEVRLSNLELGMKLPYALFVFKDPSGRGQLNN